MVVQRVDGVTVGVTYKRFEAELIVVSARSMDDYYCQPMK